MKKLRLVCIVVSLLCAAGALLAQTQPSIVGTWKLISYENHNADGTTDYPYGEKPAGYFVYDATGHLSVQIMRTPPMKDVPGLQGGKGTGEQYKEAFNSFDAYFGTYTVDAGKGIVTHHVELRAMHRMVTELLQRSASAGEPVPMLP